MSSLWRNEYVWANCCTFFIKRVVAGAFFFAAMCWCSSIISSDTRMLCMLIRKSGSALVTAPEPLGLLTHGRMLQRNRQHIKSPAWPTSQIAAVFSVGGSFTSAVNLLWYRNSFQPTTAKMYNDFPLCRERKHKPHSTSDLHTLSIHIHPSIGCWDVYQWTFILSSFTCIDQKVNIS